MPIVGDKNNLHIEYTIPEHIKILITDDFLKEFRKQLFRIFKDISLETFAEYGIPYNTPTGGYVAAFGKACLITKNEELFNYWRSLPCYDSDVFDGEITEMLIERKFILDDLSKIIEEKLGLKEEDTAMCNDCGRLYTKDVVIEIKNPEEIFISEYRCLRCEDAKETKTDSKNVTNYYLNVLNELEFYIHSLGQYRAAIQDNDESQLISLLEEGRKRKEEVDG